MSVKVSTVIRTAVLLLALINQILAALGKSPLPITDEQLSELISAGLTVLASLWGWWKNNSFTGEAVQADTYLEKLREDSDIK